MGLYWEPCPGGARLLRLLGDTPCPAVPGTIEGLPVAELGPYCFADRPVRPGARRTGDDTHEITGNFVEEVTLPDTVRVLDSAAFYNCRRLRRLSFGAADLTVGSADTSIAGMLCEGRFALYLAGEPYRSGLKAQGCGKLKKAVFSIELDADEEDGAEEE